MIDFVCMKKRIDQPCYHLNITIKIKAKEACGDMSADSLGFFYMR